MRRIEDAISAGLWQVGRAEEPGDISGSAQGHVELEFLCPSHISRTSCCSFAGWTIYFGLWDFGTHPKLEEDAQWVHSSTRCFVEPEGLPAQEARVRFLRDFCDLKVEGQQRNSKDTCRIVHSQKKKPALQAKGDGLWICLQLWKKSSSGSATLTLLYCWWGEGRGVPWARVPVCVLGPLLFF